LRETTDTVERIGIQRTWDEIARADVILHLCDVGAAAPALDDDIVAKLPPRTPVVQVVNKIDLLPAGVTPPPGIAISAKTGQGLPALRAELLRIAGWNPGAESPYLARERHLAALASADEHLEMAALHAAQDDRVLDLFAEELRLAHLALCEITGQFTSDELLGAIFSRF